MFDYSRNEARNDISNHYGCGDKISSALLTCQKEVVRW